MWAEVYFDEFLRFSKLEVAYEYGLCTRKHHNIPTWFSSSSHLQIFLIHTVLTAEFK